MAEGQTAQIESAVARSIWASNECPTRCVDGPIWFATVLAIVGAIAWVIASRAYDSCDDEWQGLFIEASGAVMGLVVFGVVMLRWDRKREVRSQQERIDDFNEWDSDEARL